MQFDKEYIELCKSSKVQGLYLNPKVGDFLYEEWFPIIKQKEPDVYIWNISTVSGLEEKLYIYSTNVLNGGGRGTPFHNKGSIWLPTGDQLDQEIIKICKEQDLLYRVDCESNYLWETKCEAFSYGENEMVAEAEHLNPLIAKISLLIQLLEGE